MMTVYDPDGTPVPYFNRDGITVDDAVATGVDLASAFVLTAYSCHTIVRVFSRAGQTGVVLPLNCVPGDCVEIYNQDVAALEVYPSQQEFLNGGSAPVTLPVYTGAVFRKVTTTNWYVIKGG